MDTVLSIVLWGGLLFLMMKFGCGSHMFGHSHGSKTNKNTAARQEDNLNWGPPEKDTDPVCGMVVSTDGAKSSVHDGLVYYFCSHECREKFEATPETYLGHENRSKNRQMENNHV